MSSKAIRSICGRIEYFAVASASPGGVIRAFKSGTAVLRSPASDTASNFRVMLRSYQQQPQARSCWLPAPGTNVHSLHHPACPPSLNFARLSSKRHISRSSGAPSLLSHKYTPGARSTIQHQTAAAANGGITATSQRTHCPCTRGLSSFPQLQPSLRRGLTILSSREGHRSSQTSDNRLFGMQLTQRGFGVLRRRQPDEEERYSQSSHPTQLPAQRAHKFDLFLTQEVKVEINSWEIESRSSSN